MKVRGTVTDVKGKATSFTYDDFGSRVSRTAPQGTGSRNGVRLPSCQVEAEKVKVRGTVTDVKGKATSFTYDDFGRRVSRTAPDTGLNGYGYTRQWGQASKLPSLS